MAQYLALHVRLLDRWYSASGEYPPSPFRLFQALVAAAGLGHELEEYKETLGWLESLDPPIIAAPHAHRGQRYVMYMPNNDSDTIKGDLRKLSKIRGASKIIYPYILDEHDLPFIYIWTLKDNSSYIQNIIKLAKHIYQLGRGTDMAAGWAEVWDRDAFFSNLASYPGVVYTPGGPHGGKELATPAEGSLSSLINRHRIRRFIVHNKGPEAKKRRRGGGVLLFTNAPRPWFRKVRYNAPQPYRLFELRDAEDPSRFLPWELEQAYHLMVQLRDSAIERLSPMFPEMKSIIQAGLLGRRPGEPRLIPPEGRVKIVPIPSVGHPLSDMKIRRFLVIVPHSFPMAAEDVFWAFSGLRLVLPSGQTLLTVKTDDTAILRHLGMPKDGDDCYFSWHSVTPVILPFLPRNFASLPPKERIRVGGRSIRKALRHAHIPAQLVDWDLRPAPFELHGSMADEFLKDTRFSSDGYRTWHVSLVLNRAIQGPVTLGDGRFMGLGLMVPDR